MKDREKVRQGMRREEVDQCGLTGLTIVIIGSASQTKGAHTLKDKEEDRQGMRREEVDQGGLTGLTIVIIGSVST